jgi:peptide/nickel transport system substrate-binding protein
VIENAQGRPFRFEVITNLGNTERKDITEIVQAQLARVGIDLRPRILEWGQMLETINDVERRDFDAMLISWVTEFRIDDTDLFHCDKMDAQYQWVSYCNPQTDRLLDTLPTIVDRAASRPVWQQYQRQIAQDQPYTILYFTTRLEGVHERLRNVDPDARGDWVGIARWYLLPTMRNR